MARKFLVLNHAVLFLCSSMYLGTGWSLALFSFPLAPHLTPDTYYFPFVMPVEAATRFFAAMTSLMMVLALIMIVAERRTKFRWVPIVVLACLLIATGITVLLIFPYNREMEAGITDPERLAYVLDRWMSLNWLRISFWTIPWLALMAYFGVHLYQHKESIRGR
jgi:hypothetical protein